MKNGIIDQGTEDWINSITATFNVSTEDDFRFFLDCFGGGTWIFRGHAQANWKLTTGLERMMDGERRFLKRKFKRCTHCDELFAIKAFREEVCAQIPFGDDYIRYLGVMQHFGARTRLLDFTTSPWIALGFAYEEPYLKCCRAVWAVRMNAISGDERFSDVQNIRPFLLEKGQEHNVCHSIPVPFEGMFVETNERRVYFHSVANANIAMTKEEELREKCGVQPLFLTGNCYRQDVQRALFLMPYTFDSFSKNLAYTFDVDERFVSSPPLFSRKDMDRDPRRWKTFALVKLVFSPKFEPVAHEVLARAQISSRTLYPDLEGVAKSIRYH